MDRFTTSETWKEMRGDTITNERETERNEAGRKG